MSSVVLKLFAGQGTGWTDRQTKRQLYASPFASFSIIHIWFIFKWTL